MSRRSFAVTVAVVASLAACGGNAAAESPSSSQPEPSAQPEPSPEAAVRLLPDLRMARLQDVQLDAEDDGRRLLRFTATIVNVGTGPMEVRATRDREELGRGVQRIYDADGGFSDVPAEATFFWAGDGHDHWHVRDMQAYRVESLDESEPSAVSEKHGFCLFDNAPATGSYEDASAEAAYTCPSSEDASSIRMGLSVGWRDVYPASLPNQYIDVSNLPVGRYRLWAEADPATDERPNGWFVESAEDNNLTWIDVELDPEAGTVQVLEYGPSA